MHLDDHGFHDAFALRLGGLWKGTVRCVPGRNLTSLFSPSIRPAQARRRCTSSACSSTCSIRFVLALARHKASRGAAWPRREALSRLAEPRGDPLVDLRHHHESLTTTLVLGAFVGRTNEPPARRGCCWSLRFTPSLSSITTRSSSSDPAPGLRAGPTPALSLAAWRPRPADFSSSTRLISPPGCSPLRERRSPGAAHRRRSCSASSTP